MNKNDKYEWYASGNAPDLYPTKLFFGNFILLDDSKCYIPPKSVFATDWGRSMSMDVSGDDFKLVPKAIDIVWYSILENKFYSVEAVLPSEKMEELLKLYDKETKDPLYSFIIAGMAPYGDLAIWLEGGEIITEIAWIKGEQVDVEWADFLPYSLLSREEYVKSIQKDCKEAYENFQKSGLPDRMLFERYMQKFNYHITPKFENEEAVFEGIELYYYNGELNTTNSGEHTENAMRAKPYKIVLNWSIGKTQYGGYFWTDEKKIIDTFSKFYGNDAQKEGCLTIEVGKSNDQFKFFLQDNSFMIEIPVEDMQIMVFKNKFEFFRSANYNKSPGGWMN
jgi:hypothetical protein